MSKLDDCQKAAAKLAARRDELQGKLAAAQADEQALQGQRAALEQRVYGQEDTQAEGLLEKAEAAIAKNQGRQRGLAAEVVATIEALNVAREELRGAQLAAAAGRIRQLDKDISRLEAELAPLRAERMAIVVGRQGITTVEERARHAEAEEFADAREVHAGFTVSRTITTEGGPL
jgi:chromosome segregation ATPase